MGRENERNTGEIGATGEMKAETTRTIWATKGQVMGEVWAGSGAGSWCAHRRVREGEEEIMAALISLQPRDWSAPVHHTDRHFLHQLLRRLKGDERENGGRLQGDEARLKGE